MKRDEEIRQVAESYAKGIAQDAFKKMYCRTDFIAGAEWADSHPHWISAEDELPKEKGWILAVAGDVDMFEYEGESAIVLKDMYHITHWMPLPEAPKKGGEG